MRTLPLDVSRCSGTIRFNSAPEGEWPVHDTCAQRDTCQRYQAWRHWDKEAGIPDYQGISVTMAVDGCRNKIEVAECTSPDSSP